jgi:hypothetical protein
MMHAKTILVGTLAAAALIAAGLVTASQTDRSGNDVSDLVLRLRTRPNGLSSPWKITPDPYPASSRRTDPVAARFLADPFDMGEQGPGSRTAVYAIATQAVYLPDGRVLEAHSGLGSHADNPSSARVRNRGTTPPNVYELSLRERLFHGVRAITGKCLAATASSRIHTCCAAPGRNRTDASCSTTTRRSCKPI